MSSSRCQGLLKCSATGKPGGFLVIARRCSPVRSLSMRPVSPMYRTGQRRHEVQQTTSPDLQVKCSLMAMLCRGPSMMVVADTECTYDIWRCHNGMCRPETQGDFARKCAQEYSEYSGLVDRMLREERGKISLVVSSFIRMLKFVRRIFLM